ncbi:ROK family protein [Chitinophaga qingshengii]|uniref:ROK family protein n=1 Tax=Chitinophaga qingshengii TaxID=1569794 RepID=A0ABR7TUZ4_9BACT|nr:ROK family protein [Chitinophaga qingshengii]MBC9934310.1 ROK family protein [Chitinophaga qingshengii]
MKSSMALGIDIGGSHITAALVNLETRTIDTHSWHRTRVNSQGSATEIIEAWAAVINDAFGDIPADTRYIGIGMPGPFDYELGISRMKDQHKYDALYDLNVKQLLAAKLGLTPDKIRFINDAGCFLQGEVFSGAGRNYGHVIGLTLGTGLGSAIYHGGLAADADRWCTPYRDGIAEDYLSTRWFVKRYLELTGKTVKDVKELTTYLDSDPVVQQVFDEFAHNLANFLTGFIRDESPEAIVIGGNIAQASALFFPAVKRELAQHNYHMPLLEASLGEQAAILGAASIWYE